MSYVRQGHGQHEQVDLLAQERVQARLVEPAVPRAGELARGVARAGHDEAVVALRLGRRAGGGGVS